MQTSALLGLAAAWCGPGAAAHSPPLAQLLGVPLALPADRDRDREQVMLTFDDGPHPEGTPAILQILRAHDVRAVFFLVGEQVERHPELVRAIVEGGHQVALHGYRHRNQMRLTPRTFADDLARGLDVLGSVTGGVPRLYRPPYGIFTLPGLAAVRRAGLSPLLWSRWGRDWRRRATPEGIAETVLPGLRAGDVILLHDSDSYSSHGSHRRTAAALPIILTAAAERGLGFTT